MTEMDLNQNSEEIIENAAESEETAGNSAQSEAAEADAPSGEVKLTTKDIKKIKDEIQRQKAEYDALNDKYLRLAAEYDNFRKRTSKEKESMYTGAVADVLKIILPVYDNTERAALFSEPEKVLEGVKMILGQFGAALGKLKVEEIPAVGEKFNPELHNAVFHEEDDSGEENVVTEVLEKGFIKGDRVIRPAMVKVKN